MIRFFFSILSFFPSLNPSIHSRPPTTLKSAPHLSVRFFPVPVPPFPQPASTTTTSLYHAIVLCADISPAPLCSLPQSLQFRFHLQHPQLSPRPPSPVSSPRPSTDDRCVAGFISLVLYLLQFQPTPGHEHREVAQSVPQVRGLTRPAGACSSARSTNQSWSNSSLRLVYLIPVSFAAG
jgi:hypothetical protein